MPVTHSKVSAVADGADATLVRPSDWNATHTIGTPFTVQGADFAAVNPFVVRIGTQRATITFPSGANGALVYSAVTPGVAANAITIMHFNPGAPNQVLSVGVVGNAITVNLATDGASAITSTAILVKAAIEASGPASALITVAHGAGSNGTGIVGTGTVQLEGGLDAGNALVISERAAVSMGALDLTPPVGALYGLTMNLNQAFEDAADGRFVILFNGLDSFIIDQTGMDLFATVGGGGEAGTYIRLLGTQGAGRDAWLTSNRIEMGEGTTAYFKISLERGLMLRAFTPSAAVDFSTMQMSFIDTVGAPAMRITAKDSADTQFTKDIPINGGAADSFLSAAKWAVD